MSTTAVLARPETWPDIPERDGYEYVDGKWVKLAVGLGATWIAHNLGDRVGDFALIEGLGLGLPHEVPYQIWPEHPKRYRKPDGSFIRRERLPAAELPEGYIHIVPALVIEVVSPRDIVDLLDLKVAEYFEAGVELVWVLHPKTKTVMVYRLDGSTSWLKPDDFLSGEDVLPGFRVPVAELFSLRIP